MQAAVTASGADCCSVNADVFVDGDKVSIIEMGGRTGATCIPELISIYYGFDFYEKMIRSALGEKVEFRCAGSQPCMAKLLLSPVEGKITHIDWDRIYKLREQGVTVALDFLVGHKVFAMSDGTDRIGHIIAKTEDESRLDAWMLEAYRAISVDGVTLEEIWKR